MYHLNPSNLIFCFLIGIFFIAGNNGVYAQKFLQLEKRNSLKTTRFHLSDEITFRTKQGGKDWYTRSIWDLDRDQGHLSLNNTTIKLEDITYLRTKTNRGWSKTLARSIQTFGTSWLVYNGMDALFYDGGDWGVALTVFATSYAVSIPLEQIFKWDRHNLKKRKRLRIMDVRF